VFWDPYETCKGNVITKQNSWILNLLVCKDTGGLWKVNAIYETNLSFAQVLITVKILRGWYISAETVEFSLHAKIQCGKSNCWHSIVCKEWDLFVSQILILQGLFLENVFQCGIWPSKPLYWLNSHAGTP